ncbi:MAG TPA: PspC domain-containing protein [Thermomicrobiales bacterium]|nr:PspC domain-containing protein [Thermomicrobiales bacterium]
MERMDLESQRRGARLVRSRRDRLLFGVCGGLGEYFDVDPLLVRLAFVLITLAGGAGVLAYIILAIIMPEAAPHPAASATTPTTGVAESAASAGPFTEAAPGAGRVYSARRHRRSSATGAFLLVTIGLLLLLANLGWFDWFRWHPVWPVVLIVLGLALLARRTEPGA